MTNIVRDRDTDDGGKKGQITSNLADIDGIVRRAWQAIHEGAEGCIETAVDLFIGGLLQHLEQEETLRGRRDQRQHGPGFLLQNPGIGRST